MNSEQRNTPTAPAPAPAPAPAATPEAGDVAGGVAESSAAVSPSAPITAAPAAVQTGTETPVPPSTPAADAGKGGVVEVSQRGDWLQAVFEGGTVSGRVLGNNLRISDENLSAEQRGKGYDTRMYQALVDEALKRGLNVQSASTVNEDTVRVYESLRRQGYQVQQNPQSFEVPGGSKALATGNDTNVFVITPTSTTPSTNPDVPQSAPGFRNLDTSGRTAGFLNTEILAEGAALIRRGVTDFTNWSQAMVTRFGRAIREFLVSIWQQIKPMAADALMNYMQRSGSLLTAVGTTNLPTANLQRGLLQITKAQTVAGRTVGTSNPTTAKRTGEGTDPNHNVELARLRVNNPEAYRKNALLLTRYPLVAREQPELAARLAKIDQPVEKAQRLVDKANADLKQAKYQVQKALSGLLKRPTAKVKAAEVEAWLQSDPGSRLTKAVRRQQENVARETDQLEAAKAKQKSALATLLESKRIVTLEAADAIYESYVTAVESNLEMLIKLFPAKLRDTARLWYDGANIIAQNFGRRFDATLEQASAVLAVFSPQKDWFMNVSLAERMMSIWKNDQDTAWSRTMSDRFLMRSGEPQPAEDDQGNIVYDEALVDEWNPEGIKYQKGARPGPPDENGNTTWLNWDNAKAAAAVIEARNVLTQVEGRTLRELEASEHKARFIRMLSEVRDNVHYPKVTPDGKFGGLMTNDKGVRMKIAWGGYNTIEKAISIMSSTVENEQEVISAALGDQHKVRSFYNNIADPANTSGHVTMDTHAVAALLWMPLSGASGEVTQNFGSGGVQNDGIGGLKGMYAANAEAYRRAGEVFGLLPREVQSITWEAVRLLFPKEFKSKANVAKVRQVWDQYRRHELTIDQARKAIFKLAQGRDLGRAIADGRGVGSPSWAAEMGDGQAVTQSQNPNDTGEFPAARGAEPGSGRLSGEPGAARRGRDRAAVVRPAAERGLSGFRNLDTSGRTAGFLNTEILAEGAALIRRGVTDFTSWSLAMVQRFGATIREFLAGIWQQIKPMAADALMNYMQRTGAVKMFDRGPEIEGGVARGGNVMLTVAPLRRDSIDEMNMKEVSKRASSAKFLHLQQITNDVAGAYGVKVTSRQPLIGGWTENGVPSLEVPELVEFDTTDLDVAEEMAVVIAASAPELQNGALVWRDDPAGADIKMQFRAKGAD